MNIVIGSDHAGFPQKASLKEYLLSLGHTVVDVGTGSTESCDYPDFADPAARMVASGKADFGVLICGTGIGMCLCADKVPGVRAVALMDPEFARLARAHNNANIIGLSGRFVSVEDNKKLLDIFLHTAFEGGKHARRVEKIMREDDPDFSGFIA